MDVYDVVKIVIAIASFLFATLIPSIILLVNKWKALKKAKTEAEKQAIYNDMLGVANTLVGDAEDLYREVDAIVKQRGGTMGLVKKDGVMNKLQAICIEKGVEFDKEYWSNKIDEIVAVTRKVNAR